jgi:hypothetical protein
MIKLSKYAFVLSILLVLLNSSCEKFSGGGDSITGTWHCNDDSQLGARTYSAGIDRAGVGYDSTYFIILNFHNLGFDFETYVHLKDTVLTFVTNNQGYSISGKGYVSKSFKSIEWRYSISGSNANEFAVNALYSKQ